MVHVTSAHLRLSRLAVGLLVGALFLTAGPRDALAQEWGESGSAERREEIVSRYLEILERRPRTGHVLERLLSEIGRGSGLDQLVERYSARAEESDGPEIATLLGLLENEAERYESAIAAFELALSRDPGFSAALRGKADALADLERWDEAEAVYESALETIDSGQDRQEVLRRLADLAFAARRWDRAAGYVEEMLEQAPNDPYLRMELAQLFIEHQRWEEALAQYEAIAESAGTDARQRAVAERDSGVILAQLGRVEEAREVFERARSRVAPDYWLAREVEMALYDLHSENSIQSEFIERYTARWRPLSARQWRLIAEAYQELGQLPNAADSLRSAVRRDPGNLEATLALIRVLSSFNRSDHTEELERLYEQIVRRNPYDLGLRLEYVDFLEGEHGSERAVRALRQAERALRTAPDPLLTIADRYDRYGEPEDALRVYRELTRRYPREPRFTVALGDYHFGQLERTRAEEIWAGIVEMYPDSVSGRAALGDVHANHGLLEEAVMDYEFVVSERPDDLDYRQRLAELYERNARMLDAADTWERLYADAARTPRMRAAREALIRLYGRLGFIEQGIDTWEQQVGTSADGRWFLLVGEGQKELGDLDAAELSFRQALELRPDSVAALRLLEEVLRTSGQFEEAVAVLETISTLDSRANRWVWDSLIDISLQRFEDEQAVAYAEQAVEDFPNDAAGYARLGELHKTLGNFARAVDAYRNAVEVNDRVVDYQFALANLLVATGGETEALERYLDLVGAVRDESEMLKAGRRATSLAVALGRGADLASILEGRMLRARDPAPILKLEAELYQQWSESLGGRLPEEEKNRFHAVIRRALGSADAGVFELAISIAEQGDSDAFADALLRVAIETQNDRGRVLAALRRAGLRRVPLSLFEALPSMDVHSRELVFDLALRSMDLPDWEVLPPAVTRLLALEARRLPNAMILVYRMAPERGLEIARRSRSAASPPIRDVALLIRADAGDMTGDELLDLLEFRVVNVAAELLRCVASTGTLMSDEMLVDVGMRAGGVVRQAAAAMLLGQARELDATWFSSDAADASSLLQQQCIYLHGPFEIVKRTDGQIAEQITKLESQFREAMTGDPESWVPPMELLRLLAQGDDAWESFLIGLLHEGREERVE